MDAIEARINTRTQSAWQVRDANANAGFAKAMRESKADAARAATETVKKSGSIIRLPYVGNEVARS